MNINVDMCFCVHIRDLHVCRYICMVYTYADECG